MAIALWDYHMSSVWRDTLTAVTTEIWEPWKEILGDTIGFFSKPGTDRQKTNPSWAHVCYFRAYDIDQMT